MEPPQPGTAPSRRDTGGLGKLFPRAITSKQRRRKTQSSRTNSSLTESDGTGHADDDDRHSYYEDDGDALGVSGPADDSGSFGSFESGPEPSPSASRGSLSAVFKKASSRPGSSSASRDASRSPSRPRSISRPNQNTSTPSINREAPPPLPSSPLRAPAKAGDPTRPKTAHAVTPPTRHQTDLGLATLPKSRVDPLTLPPAIGTSSPAIVNTPPTPTLPSAGEDGASTWKTSSPADGTPPSRSLGSTHKRSTSASATIVPSRLSRLAANPLTPPIEGSEVPASPSSGFFSSMLSAAQSAANNFSTGINIGGGAANGNNNKGRVTASQSADAIPQEDSQPAENETTNATDPESASSQLPPSRRSTQGTMDQKEAAVRTLGAGDLSLSQLGVADPPSTVASPASARFAELDASRARSESAPADAAHPAAVSADSLTQGPASRPRSLNEDVPSRETTPSPAEGVDESTGLHHSSSLRSATKAHRKRGSSVTTSGTGMNFGGPSLTNVATSPLPQASANVSTPKLTGFAIASKKRNRDFHSVFKSVPDDDYLIEDYSCALQREILAHGRLYVSEGHLCFSSNILGWSTTLVMSFDEITSVEKRSTALLFKNGLMISTLHAKHVFASFTSRDATYDLIVNIWKLGHPTLTSTLNGIKVEGSGGDKTEKLDGNGSALTLEGGVAGDSQMLDSGTEEETDDDGEDDFYIEDDHEAAAGGAGAGDSVTDLNGDGAADVVGAGAVGANGDKPTARKASGMTVNGVPAAMKDIPPPAGMTDFPGPTAHAPTECGDAATHYDKVVGDEVINAPLGQVYDVMFGSKSAVFMTKFLTVDSKCTDVQMEDKKGLSLENRTRNYTYVKPLNAAIGPKSAKCIITETLDGLDYEKAANVTIATQTPEVPNGNLFTVKTKYCLSWAENNSTRVFVNCTVEWSGKSWIKGPIEKASNDGQVEHCKLMFAGVRAAVSSRSRANTGTNAGKGKKKGKKGGKAAQSTLQAAEKTQPKSSAQQSWGPLEPVRPILEPLADLVRPLLTGNVMYGLLVGLLVAAWFGFGSSRGAPNGYPNGHNGPGPYSFARGPDRMAAYEEMWRREDSNLWEWLEERTGMDRLHTAGASGAPTRPPVRARPRKSSAGPDMRQLEEALRVTQQKLRILEEAMGHEPVDVKV